MSKNLNKSYVALVNTIDSNTKKMELVAGNESVLKVLNNTFYKIDDSFKTGIKGVRDYFSTVSISMDDLEEYMTKTPNIKELYVHSTILTGLLNDGEKLNSIAKRKAPVLTGLALSLPELLEVISSNTQYVNGAHSVLSDFDDMLNDLLNSRKELVVNINSKHLDVLKKQITAMNSNLETVTDKKVLRDRIEVRKLVRSYDELDDTIMDTLQLGSNYTMEKLESLKIINDNIVNKITLISETLESGDKTINKKDLELLSSYTNLMAKFVTAVTFTYYIFLQEANMLISIVKIGELKADDKSSVTVISSRINNIANIMKKMLD